MRRILQNILLWIIALSILNTSIDAPDFNSFQVHSFSEAQYIEIESIIELLMDSILGENLPDQKGNDFPSTLKKNMTIDFSLPEKRSLLPGRLIAFLPLCVPYNFDNGILCRGFKTFFSPPPDLLV